MLKLFKKFLLCAYLVIAIVVVGFWYNTYKSYKVYNNLFKTIDSSSTDNNSAKNSSDNYDSYLEHPSLNPSTIIEENDTSIESDSIEDIANNYTIEVKDIEISQEIESNSEVNEILSNKSNFNLAVKLNDVGTLVSLDNSSNKISIFKFDGNNFESLKDSTNKYIDMNLSDYPTIDSLKDEFINADLFGKYNLFSNILNNSDTNLSESDIISLYFSSLSK